MHVNGYVWARDNIVDLDHLAKGAVLAVAARANQRNGTAWVSLPRLAKDMGASRSATWEALNRAVEAGYLTVEKHPGHRSGWQLRGGPPAGLHPSASRYAPVRPADPKGVRRNSMESGPAPDGPSAPVETRTRDGIAFAPGTGRLPNWTRGES
jgi:biotin operon repressor